MKKVVIMSRLTRLEDADDSFDLEFWRKVGPEGILEAMCQMVDDYYKLRGYGHPPRLRRSVAVLKRR
jgi:hypothetical protein